MTQRKKQADKIALLNASFVMLDEHNQDYILAVLQTLKYAQNSGKMLFPVGGRKNDNGML